MSGPETGGRRAGRATGRVVHAPAYPHKSVLALWLGLLVAGHPDMVAAQDPVIRDSAAASYLGRHVTVIGTVVASQRRPNGELWLSFGERYPRATLVVVVDAATVFEHPGVLGYRGRDVRVQGRVLSPTAEAGERPRVPYIRLENVGRIREVRPGDEVPPAVTNPSF